MTCEHIRTTVAGRVLYIVTTLQKTFFPHTKHTHLPYNASTNRSFYRQEQALLDVKAAAEAAKLVLEEDAKRSAEALKAKRSLVQYHVPPFTVIPIFIFLTLFIFFCILFFIFF